MKYSYVAVGAALLSQAVAFPAIAQEAAMKMAARAAEDGSLKTRIKRFLMPNPGFDAATQYVSNQGAHKFVPPGPGDQRGPCPGLNAMANHNYLPHNGVATIQQFVDGTNFVFGMGIDLAAFLAVYGAVMDGDLTSWSIGGPTPGLLSSVGLLGTPQGISGSHNKYEGDASPTRGDLYQVGNDYLLQMSQFQDLYNRQASQTEATSNYDLQILTDMRYERQQQSVANNPNFFYGPFTGIAVTPAAYTFIYRFMANKSSEYPEGRLSKKVMRQYTISFFQTDLLAQAAQHPEFLNVGGNTGTTNSFTGVDVSSLTGGVYNSQTLLQGNNLMCFASQAAQQGAPDLLKGVFADTTAALSKLSGAVASATSGLGCPQLAAIDAAQFSKYPGYVKSKN
ncbi:hypothetical protein B0A49_03195 [Cryomyces minteri]|uniref:Heme haloperoxidase family profile domain-containing protein n=1 Tax=Cryomyces minteri TaxID=331657 RepID=A0A4U0XHU7_9PEZI|nr:hypothetical protein B0A49_03195 [Cryomyces minteri]